jgi:hypothetical protein
MSEIQHTPGPWRWEFNGATKSVQLVGGKPRYDLTIMDFDRWGMGGAVPRFIEPSESANGLMLMHRLCDRKDWIAPFPNRDHHFRWCAAVTHPDARLMAAAPDLLEALQAIVEAHAIPSSICKERPVYEAALAAISKATGAQS